MTVDIFESSDIVDLGQLLWLQIKRLQYIFDVLHILENECFCLVKHQIFDVSKKVCVHRVFQFICSLVYFETCDHPHSQWGCNDDIRGVELLIELNLQD